MASEAKALTAYKPEVGVRLCDCDERTRGRGQLYYADEADTLIASLTAERNARPDPARMEKGLADGCPDPAQAFTAGPERRLADLIRMRVAAERDAARERAEALDKGFAELIRAVKTNGGLVGYHSVVLDAASRARKEANALKEPTNG